MPRFPHFVNPHTEIPNESLSVEEQEDEAGKILAQLPEEWENPLTQKDYYYLKKNFAKVLIVALGIAISASNANEEAIGNAAAPVKERSKSVARS